MGAAFAERLRLQIAAFTAEQDRVTAPVELPRKIHKPPNKIPCQSKILSALCQKYASRKKF